MLILRTASVISMRWPASFTVPVARSLVLAMMFARKAALSKREISCMRWVAEGKSSWEIGMILGVSENTLNFHVKNAMRKLGATSRIQAVAIAIRLNVL
ncbi:helix-turn-helix domain-containing protein [Bradyrhizobium sp. CCBAU 53380]|uniref:helix-turn-helix domain-containing protein n=1 Tax=Bradyrhizobium sp. CCBAU 53380 TaxID=1325117 RepID=UPI002FE1F0F4